MSRRFLFALVAGLALLAGASADPAPAPVPAARAPEKARPTGTDAILAFLHEQEVVWDDNINEIPLWELLQKMTKWSGLNISVNEQAFKTTQVNDIKELKPNVVATQLRGLTGHQFLATVLEGMDATYLVRGGRIEIVPVAYAARVAKAKLTEPEDGPSVLAEPLVCVSFKEKALNEAVALVAVRYDLTVVVAPQSGDARAGFVTARLLNVPADKALDLLAVQCDLRVVRQANAFLVTSRDHANELFAERVEREKQEIELERLKEGPPPAPAPVPEPPKPEPKQ
ncbi:unnamed protein product [Gemmataceae bacterium]|nr:unnamed protein product [Gemmataceae bacterium]VTU02317.1 unnamed protein product [Gemmataceae bacterium]